MTKIISRFDHLVLTAPSLRIGTEYLFDYLGVYPQPGGVHLTMGTHNALLRIGQSTYIEVLAVSPNSPAPAGRRWFELDQVNSTEPQLRAWVVRTNDIRAIAKSATIDPGPIKNMSRDDFEWQMTIPDDGSIPLDGVAPALLQWSTRSGPAESLTPSRCKLTKIVLQHMNPRIVQDLLESIQFRETDVEVKFAEGPPCLSVTIETPLRTVMMHSLRKPFPNTVHS